MSRVKALIGFGFFLLIAGIFLGLAMLLIRFEPLSDGDSIGPDIIYCISTFTLVDYIWLFLTGGFLFSGLITTATGIIIMSKSIKVKEIQNNVTR